MQLFSPATTGSNLYTGKYLYTGEWRSRVIAVNSSTLCLSISVFVPIQLYLYVDLLSDGSKKTTNNRTVFDVVHVANKSEVNLVSEIQLQEAATLIQIVVYVSDNTIIRSIDVTNGNCAFATRQWIQSLLYRSSVDIIVNYSVIIVEIPSISLIL